MNWAINLFYGFAFLCAVAFLYFHYAKSQKILDIPSRRSSHTTPVIRGGGILFAAGILLAVLRRPSFFFRLPALAFVAGFLILAATGFKDDRNPLSPRVRFPFQIAGIALILYAAGLWQADFPWYVKLIAGIVSLGFVNAFNFMDGINGITGMYAFIILFTYWFLNTQYHLLPDELFLFSILSILIFGGFNFRQKALMFAGDVGSMSLAALILYIVARFMIYLKSPVLLLTVLIYGVDSAMTIIFRLIKREDIFKAHRWHVYQKFVDRYGWSHLQTASLYALLQFFINGWVIKHKLYIYDFGFQVKLLILLLFVTGFIYLFIQKNKLFEKEN